MTLGKQLCMLVIGLCLSGAIQQGVGASQPNFSENPQDQPYQVTISKITKLFDNNDEIVRKVAEIEYSTELAIHTSKKDGIKQVKLMPSLSTAAHKSPQHDLPFDEIQLTEQKFVFSTLAPSSANRQVEPFNLAERFDAEIKGTALPLAENGLSEFQSANQKFMKELEFNLPNQLSGKEFHDEYQFENEDNHTRSYHYASYRYTGQEKINGVKVDRYEIHSVTLKEQDQWKQLVHNLPYSCSFSLENNRYSITDTTQSGEMKLQQNSGELVSLDLKETITEREQPTRFHTSRQFLDFNFMRGKWHDIELTRKVSWLTEVHQSVFWSNPEIYTVICGSRESYERRVEWQERNYQRKTKGRTLAVREKDLRIKKTPVIVLTYPFTR